MNQGPRFLSRFVVFSGVCLGLAGCGQGPVPVPPAGPTPVTVSYPVEQYVTDYADFTGRTAAVDSVEVRAHVWGYLDRVNFKEGALVKKGDVLFEIDPRTYKAALAQAEANLVQARAHADRLAKDLARSEGLVSTRAISQEDYDKTAGDKAEADAAVGSAAASRDTARLNLDFTHVLAPVSGRVSRILVTVGNLIQSGDMGGGTVLTTIVSVDPIYAYFDVDEGTVLRVEQLIRQGKVKSARQPGVSVAVFLGLANEEGYPRRGTLNFVDNQVNPKTGTLRVRGIFANKDESLTPGLFVRIRVPIGEPHQALLITERAIDTDQGQKIVYVVDPDNKVASRPISLGPFHDGLRVIESGVKPGERLVVNGLQQIRPGMPVDSKLVDMPGVGGQRSEVSGRKSEIGGQKSEIASQKSAANGVTRTK